MSLREDVDPKNEQVHLVTLLNKQRFKDGVTAKISALCGKRWAPSWPPPKPMHTYEHCVVCRRVNQRTTERVAEAV